jgi:hypothetical protein
MMDLLASCKQRLAERRAEKLAKTQSDKIDRQLREERLAYREQPQQGRAERDVAMTFDVRVEN